MALPNPNPSGGGAAVIQFPGNFVSQENKYKKEHLELLNDGFDSIRDSLNVLSKNIADLIFFLKGESAEQADLKTQERDVKDVAGSVAGKDDLFGNLKDLNIGFGDILLGAIAAYALGIDKYIRTVFLAKTIAQFAKIPEAFASISKAIKGSKLFKELSRIIKYYTVPLKNIVDGFKNIGKELQAFGKTVTVSFKELSFMGKIGAVIRKIVNPFISFFKIFGQLTGITGTVSKIAPMFAKIMPILKGIGSKLLLPLFAIFDFVSGFIEGFASKGEGDTRSTMEKLLDGLAGGFIKMIKGIFIVPLDLLKQGVSWIAGKLGFEQFEKFLDEKVSFNDMFDGILKFAKNLFASEPEEGTFSLVKSISNIIDDIKKWFQTNIVDAFADMSFDPILKSWENAFSGLKNFGQKVYDTFIKPIVDKVSSLFGGDEGDEAAAGSNFDISNMFGDIDFSFLNPMKIASKIGEMINNALQSFAQSLDNSIVPGTGSLAKMIANAGVGIAEYMGAENIKKFNADSKSADKMDIVKGSLQTPTLTKEGKDVAQKSSEVGASQRKETGGKGGSIVDASQNFQKGGDKIDVMVAQGKPAATSGDLALGTFGPSR